MSDQVLFLSPSGDPMIGPADEVDKLDLAGSASRGWTDIQRLHAEEERRLHHVEKIPSGRYHVKGGRGVGRAHVHVQEDGSGIYVNSRGELAHLTPAQVRSKYEGGFQHRLGPALTEDQLTAPAPPAAAPVPKPLDVAPEWTSSAGKVKVAPKVANGLLKGQTSRAEFEVRDALDKQAKYLPSTVYKSRVEITSDVRTARGSNTLGDFNTGHNIRIHPEATATGFKAANPGVRVVKTIAERSNEGGWWSGADKGHSTTDQVVAHEIGHAVADDLAMSMPTHQRYLSGGWNIPGDPKMWEAIEKGIAQEASGDPNAKPEDVMALPTSKLRRAQMSGSSSEVEAANPTFDSGEIEAWMERHHITIGSTVSKYAAATKEIVAVRVNRGRRETQVVGHTHDPHEMLAELWSEYTMKADPRPPAKAYGDYVMQNLQGRVNVPPVRRGVWT